MTKQIIENRKEKPKKINNTSSATTATANVTSTTTKSQSKSTITTPTTSSIHVNNNNTDEVNTEDIAKKIKDLIKKNRFTKNELLKVFEISAQTMDDIINTPKHWNMLTQRKKIVYSRIQCYLCNNMAYLEKLVKENNLNEDEDDDNHDYERNIRSFKRAASEEKKNKKYKAKVVIRDEDDNDDDDEEETTEGEEDTDEYHDDDDEKDDDNDVDDTDYVVEGDQQCELEDEFALNNASAVVKSKQPFIGYDITNIKSKI